MENLKLDGMLTAGRLLKRIHTLNHLWKFQQKDGQTVDAHGEFFRQMKLNYQLELLRQEFPSIYLKLDPAETSEEIYSICLPQPIEGYSDGAHLPKRLADMYLSDAEINVLVRN